METFTRRVKMLPWKKLVLKWESTEALSVGPYINQYAGNPNPLPVTLTHRLHPNSNPHAVLEAARSFPHGMYEVSANDFGKDLIDAG